MKATTLLERQHRNLQQLCEAVERGSASVRHSLLPQLAGDLVAHIAVEDQVFYPAACDALHEEACARCGRSRHAQVRKSLERALEAGVDGEDFVRAIGELREVVELHAEEEEELLFPRVDRAMDAEAMRELAFTMLSLYRAKVEAGCGLTPAYAAPPPRPCP
ncbi:MAG: hemerythrin domain-containing protein [Polyangiaceae bacterium]